MQNFPLYGLISVVVMLVVYFLKKESRKGPRLDADGHRLVVLPGFYGALGLFSCGVGLAVLLYGLLNYHPENIGPQLMILALFAGLGLYLVLMAYVARLTLLPEGLRQRGMLGQQHFMRWQDVQTVEYSAFSMALKVSDGKRKVTCYSYAVGFSQLVEELTRHLGRSRAELGIPQL